jgi:hypothetical protein
MRDVDRMRLGDARGERAMRGKSVRAVAAQNVRQAPEGVGHHANRPAAAVRAVEGNIVIVGHARHHQRPGRAHCGEQRHDEGLRSGSNPGEGGMD